MYCSIITYPLVFKKKLIKLVEFVVMNSYFSTSDDSFSFDIYNKKLLRSGYAFSLLSFVTLWYSAAVITITTSKLILNIQKLPFLLCTIQFLFASVGSFLYLYVTGSFKKFQSVMLYSIIQISMSYTFGFVLTNWSFSIGNFIFYYLIYL
jgi:hypothetical protein